MSYRLTSYGKTRLGLPGIPWRDMSDEEFAAAVARHPGIEDKGYFVKDEPVEEEPQRRRFGRQSVVEAAAISDGRDDSSKDEGQG